MDIHVLTHVQHPWSHNDLNGKVTSESRSKGRYSRLDESRLQDAFLLPPGTVVIIAALSSVFLSSLRGKMHNGSRSKKYWVFFFLIVYL